MDKKYKLMKRFLLLIFSLYCIGFTQAQNPMQAILKDYFRTNPFETRFSTYLTSLQKDPWLSIEEFSRRTDSSFFYLTGTYKNYNPFHYPVKEVRLIVAEGQFIHTDSLKTLDTIITIQLLGITDTTSSNKANVTKEFKRFYNKYASAFWNYSYDKVEKANQLTAEVYNYFIYPYSISPISDAWGRIPGTNQFTFTITIRCKVKENIADVILSPNEH
jgi:hypothetical protein